MSKTIFKYGLDGRFICSYKNCQQAANDLGVDESSIRKPLKYNDVTKVKDFYFTKTKWTPETIKEEIKVPAFESQAKVLILDIETAPMKAFAWKLWDVNIGKGQLIQDWFMLSWSAKWLFEPVTHAAVLTSEEAINCDDRRIVSGLWELFDKADIIIGHNAKGFDIPKCNTRFLIHGFAPPKPYQVIDTMLAIKGGTFGFSRNSLDFVTDALQLDKKKDTDFSLWVKCLAGDPVALNEMMLYNANDVVITEELYNLIRPWIKAHPNMGNFTQTDEKKCPVCGGTHLNDIGTYYALVNQYTVFRCGDCTSLSRSNKALKNGTTINNRVISIAR